MKKQLSERLEAYPELKIHLEELLDVVEDVNGTLRKADDAEIQVVKNMRKMGSSILHEWASHQEKARTSEWHEDHSKAWKHGKKSSLGNHLWPTRNSRTTLFG